MKRKVLGEADQFEGEDFFDQVAKKVSTPGERVLEIPLEKARVKENVRSEYKDIETLAETIKRDGLLSPITVLKAKDGFFDILTGHRRYKAFLYLNGKHPGEFGKIRAIVFEKELSRAEVVRIQMIENVQREDLSAIEKKDALDELRKGGMSNGEIAEALGKSEGHVKNLFMAVASLNESPELREIAESHAGVTLTDFVEARVLGIKDRQKLLMAKARGEIKNRAELREKIQQIRGENYNKGKAERSARATKPLFKEKDSLVRVRSFAFDRAKISKDEREKLLLEVREILAKLEAVQ